ncbi:MAG: type VI secretion system baseplate subunit TssF [Pseudomonadota bacterium]
MFNKYYQEELAFLREMGREFAEAYPAAAHMLAGPGADPDVERLLEGTAFLTGRIRQKLDDEFPEITHSLMNLLFPNYLRPIPAMTMVQFEPVLESPRGRIVIPRGTEIDSTPVEGVNCRFRTSSDVVLYPLALTRAALETPAEKPARLVLKFSLPAGLTPARIGLGDLRLYLRGENREGYQLYFWLSRQVKGWSISVQEEGRQIGALELPLSGLEAAGFEENEALLPYPPAAFQGYRLLQEYFSLPEKFLMIDLKGLSAAARLPQAGEFEISIELLARPENPPRISADNILLFCSPAVNLFPHQADPIRVDREKHEYPIRPSGGSPRGREVYSIDRAAGFEPGTAKAREYKPFFSFRTGSDPAGPGCYYQTRLGNHPVGDGIETRLSFVDAFQRTAFPPTEIISLDLTCTNGRLPEKLRAGDLKLPTSEAAGFARFKNVGRITRSAPPPLGKNMAWRLISHWSLNYLSMTKVESLRTILALYNFHALFDRQAAQENELRMQGLLRAEAKPEERFYLGRPVRGLSLELEVQEGNFAGEGDIFLFGRVLREFLALYATMNSFVRLTIRGVEKRETYSWPARIGRRNLL